MIFVKVIYLGAEKPSSEQPFLIILKEGSIMTLHCVNGMSLILFSELPSDMRSYFALSWNTDNIKPIISASVCC